MSNYNSLKTTIDANIKQNGRQEITGQILNSVLNQMVTTLGAGYQFAGVATLDPATDPGTPDAKVFYIANGKGTYTNFGGLEVTEDDVVVLYWDSSWHKEATGIASQAKLSELELEVGYELTNQPGGSTSQSLINDFKAGDKVYITYKGDSYIKFIQYHNAQNVEVTSPEVDIQNGQVYEYVFPEDAKDIYFYFGNTDIANKGIVVIDNTLVHISKSFSDETAKALNDELSKVASNYIELPFKEGKSSELLYANFKKGEKIYITYEGDSYIKFIQYINVQNIEVTSPEVDIQNGQVYEYVFPEDAISINAYFGTGDKEQVAVVAYSDAQIAIYNLDSEISKLKEEKPISLETFKPQLDSLESNCYLGARTYGGAIGKCLQLAHVSDTHGDSDALKNATILAEYPTIDAVIHTGDYLVNVFSNDYGKAEYADIVAKSNKPILFALGNHDVGDGNGVAFCGTHEQVYDTFIAPLQAKGFILSNGLNYYYKDFAETKTRLIVLYEQDMPLDYDDSIWQHIAYDESYPIGVDGQSYSIGDIINIQGHTGASFKAVTDTTLNLAYDYNVTNQPAYKINRGFRVLSKQQMEWLCNTLASTPSNYGVVIALHNFFSEDISLVENKFTSKFADVNVSHNCMQTDIIAEIVHAFTTRSALNINVATKPESAYGIGNNRAAYLNGLTDVHGNKYWYNLSATFSNVDESVKFIAFIGGHTHFDAITRHNRYKELIQITETGTINVNQKNMGTSDIKTSTDAKNIAYNCINIEGFDPIDMVTRLTKIGARYNIDGKIRDFDVAKVVE